MFVNHPKIAKKWSHHTKNMKTLPNEVDEDWMKLHPELDSKDIYGKLYATPVNEIGMEICDGIDEPIDDGNHFHLTEMPHFIDKDEKTAVDLRIEKWPVSSQQKKEIMLQLQNGAVGKDNDNKWTYFSPDNQISNATSDQINHLYHLSDVWKQYAVKAESKINIPTMSEVFKGVRHE